VHHNGLVSWALIAGFAVAVTPLILTPGASLTLATQHSLAGHRAGRWWVIAGTTTGIYTHATLAAIGLSGLVMHSAEAFTVVRLLGAAYLIALGVGTVLRSLRPLSGRRRSLPWVGHHAYPQALLANVLNPKAAAIYLTLAPQFLSTGRISILPVLALATLHVLLMAGWLIVWTTGINRLKTLARFDEFRSWIDRVGGAILIAIGVRTAVTA
jgi:threonine/homoserine/homoserine lactone efflux protein